MTAGELGRWNPTVISGLLWGVIVGLLDTLGEPLEDLALADIVHFTVIVFLQWCITGLCWAMAARSAERRQKVDCVEEVGLGTACWSSLMGANAGGDL